MKYTMCVWYKTTDGDGDHFMEDCSAAIPVSSFTTALEELGFIDVRAIKVMKLTPVRDANGKLRFAELSPKFTYKAKELRPIETSGIGGVVQLGPEEYVMRVA